MRWGYWGKAWYRTQFEVPADAAGKPLTLTIGGVYNAADYDRGVCVWVNGRLMEWDVYQHQRMGGLRTLAPIHIDVTSDFHPGKSNTVAVLVHTDPPERFPRGGIHRRSFLWRPYPTAETASGETQ